MLSGNDGKTERGRRVKLCAEKWGKDNRKSEGVARKKKKKIINGGERGTEVAELLDGPHKSMNLLSFQGQHLSL